MEFNAGVAYVSLGQQQIRERKNTITGVELTIGDICSWGLGGADGVLAQDGALELIDGKGLIILQ